LSPLHSGRDGSNQAHTRSAKKSEELKNGLKTSLRPPGRPGGRHKEMRIMMWNSEGILCSGRELALSNLLAANDVDVMIIRHPWQLQRGGVHLLPPPRVLPSQDGQVQGRGHGPVSVGSICKAAARPNACVGAVDLDTARHSGGLSSRYPGTSGYSWTSEYSSPDRRPVKGVVRPRPGDDRLGQGQGAVASGICGDGQHHPRRQRKP
jgi:hypothetical protein